MAKKTPTNTTPKLLGLLLLVGSVFLGIALVTQPQLLNSRALIVRYSSPGPTATPMPAGICATGLDCQKNWALGAKACQTSSGSGYVYCCPEGKFMFDNKCGDLTTCGRGLECDFAKQIPGSKKCVIAGGEFAYCCKKGHVIKKGRCVIPFRTQNPRATATPENCDATWIPLKCGGGKCDPGERQYARFFLPESCGRSSICVLDTTCFKVNVP